MPSSPALPPDSAIWAMTSSALHRHSRHGQEPRGEVACRGLCALLGVGIEAHRAVFGPVVLREEALVLQPQAEILSHLGFQDRAAQGELTGIARPLKPCVRRDVTQHRTAARQRGADIVAAQHNHLVQRVGRLRTVLFLRGFRFCLRRVCHFHAVAVDGIKLIPLGDRIKTVGVAFLLKACGGLRRTVVAVGIIAEQHIRPAAVLFVLQGIGRHGEIARGIAEGQHGHPADFLLDHRGFVGLLILEEELTGDHQLILRLQFIEHAVLVRVAGGHIQKIRTDHMIPGDILVQHALGQHADGVPISRADNINRIVIVI